MLGPRLRSAGDGRQTHIAAEIERWRPVVKAANIRLE
jgi:hypothetical protein